MIYIQLVGFEIGGEIFLLKRRLTLNRVHGVIFQKTELSVFLLIKVK
jgi:hypothetical protein